MSFGVGFKSTLNTLISHLKLMKVVVDKPFYDGILAELGHRPQRAINWGNYLRTGMYVAVPVLLLLSTSVCDSLSDEAKALFRVGSSTFINAAFTATAISELYKSGFFSQPMARTRAFVADKSPLVFVTSAALLTDGIVSVFRR